MYVAPFELGSTRYDEKLTLLSENESENNSDSEDEEGENLDVPLIHDISTSSTKLRFL